MKKKIKGKKKNVKKKEKEEEEEEGEEEDNNYLWYTLRRLWIGLNYMPLMCINEKLGFTQWTTWIMKLYHFYTLSF